MCKNLVVMSVLKNTDGEIVGFEVVANFVTKLKYPPNIKFNISVAELCDMLQDVKYANVLFTAASGGLVWFDQGAFTLHIPEGLPCSTLDIFTLDYKGTIKIAKWVNAGNVHNRFPVNTSRIFDYKGNDFIDYFTHQPESYEFRQPFMSNDGFPTCMLKITWVCKEKNLGYASGLYNGLAAFYKIGSNDDWAEFNRAFASLFSGDNS